MSNTTQLKQVIMLAATLGQCGVKAAHDAGVLQKAADFLPMIKEVPDMLGLSETELKAEWDGLDAAGRAELVTEVVAAVPGMSGDVETQVAKYLEAGLKIASGIAQAVEAFLGAPATAVKAPAA